MRGYIEDTTFDIYECRHCNTAFSDPLKTDEFVYDVFYRHAKLVPGYERYERYASLAKSARKPMDALSSSEPIYWSAREAIENHGVSREGAILEVGSGLGYFVHALREAGYSATGIDISSEAVDRAVANYGPFFQTEDIFKFATLNVGKYDCVLMLETIEHIEDPEAFIKAGVSMLSDDGILVITTPNKDCFSAAPWSMDPPVHLWSYSEASIEKIARSLGKRVSFVDFTPYTKRFSTHVVHNVDERDPATIPYRITKNGALMPGFRVGTVKSRWLSVRVRHLLSVLLRRLRTKHVASRIPTICAVIRQG